ncbi:hypothetical protein WAI453_002523 [Rhynchosporium graminicola]|uniref:LipA and NB-ARC domain protein n=1 Tax=Rhynchosporium graminicola TaxID=2792576 RepID=A0A1E1KVT1_9HELO|nr:uncharacterized protein RCO7_11035 [Rhynchosporium commune]
MDDASALPPPYHELDWNTSANNSSIKSNNFRVPRKPIHAERPRTAPSRNQNAPPPIYFEEFKQLKQSHLQTPPPPPPPPIRYSPAPAPEDLLLNTSVHNNLIDPHTYYSPASIEPLSRGISSLNTLSPPSTLRSSRSASPVLTTESLRSSQSSNSSFIQEAFREARHFAGGLITHPVESTKHFSILRHSHGLVFYQGANTTLAISIFSDQPLPPDRTIWLQSKGWSGKTGMRAKAFMGRNGNWINVTPSLSVGSEQLKSTDERAWQRDMTHFRKKPKRNMQQYHILRETAVVRIPVEAEDGYFQLVLCLGLSKQKVLCPSPVFRILSTSTNPGSMRGASMTTLPLEIGVIALGTYARNTAGRVVGPVATIVQTRVQKLMPSWVTQQATAAAFGVLNPPVGNADTNGSQSRDQPTFAPTTRDAIPEEGPHAPFPLRFIANTELAKVGIEQFSMPSMAVTGLAAQIAQKLSGFYLGWARFLKQPIMGSSKSGDVTWYQAVISASQTVAQTPATKTIIIRLTRDYEEWCPERRVIEVRILGLIRPDDPLQRDALRRGLQARDEAAAEAAMLAEVNDIMFAENILDHPAWNPEAAPRTNFRPGTSGGQSIRLTAHRQISEVPFHKIGVRSPLEGAGVDDTPFAANGYFVTR